MQSFSILILVLIVMALVFGMTHQHISDSSPSDSRRHRSASGTSVSALDKKEYGLYLLYTGIARANRVKNSIRKAHGNSSK